jgi:hypothetical protein
VKKYSHLFVNFYVPFSEKSIELVFEWGDIAHKFSTDEIRFGKVDISDNHKLKERFKVDKMPSLQWFNKGHIQLYYGD